MPSGSPPGGSGSANGNANGGGGGGGHVEQTGMRRMVVNDRELKKRDAKFTRAAIFMVISFVFCHAPRLVPNAMEIFLNVEKFPTVSQL